MIDDSVIHNEAFLFLQKQASDLFFILSPKGMIIEANQAAERLTGRSLTGEKFEGILSGCKNALAFGDLSGSPEPERIFNIAGFSNSLQSYHCTFKKIADHILVFGRLDSEGFENSRNEMFSLNQELNNLSRKLHKKNAELTNTLSQMKTLHGILPLCVHCHRIRNDRANWDKLEAYIENQTGAQCSHSICPECLDEFYPESPDKPDD
jgi:hypothetical protein